MTRTSKHGSDSEADMTLEEEMMALRNRFEEAKASMNVPKTCKTPEERLLHARWSVVVAGFRNEVSSIGYDVDVQLYSDIASAHDDSAIPLCLQQAENLDPAVAEWAKEFESIYIKHLNKQRLPICRETDFVLITCQDFYAPDPDALDDEDEEY